MGTPQTLPQVKAGYGQGPQLPASVHPSNPPQAARHQSNTEYAVENPISPSTVRPSSFMDTSGGMSMDDAPMYLSPAEVMALFNDGGVDMASLFQPSPEYLQSVSHDGADGRSYGSSSPFGKGDGGGSEETKNRMGLGSSP